MEQAMRMACTALLFGLHREFGYGHFVMFSWNLYLSDSTFTSAHSIGRLY